MTKAEKPNPCQCGCQDVWCVVDYGAWHIECAECNRHTGPYLDVDNAVRAWNLGTDIREPGSVKADFRGNQRLGAATERRF